MTSVIEDRECTCGHFYGNHMQTGREVFTSFPCKQCRCRDYTPATPLEGDDRPLLIGGACWSGIPQSLEIAPRRAGDRVISLEIDGGSGVELDPSEAREVAALLIDQADALEIAQSGEVSA